MEKAIEHSMSETIEVYEDDERDCGYEDDGTSRHQWI